MTNELSEPAWSGYEQEIPAHNGSVAGSNPAGDTSDLETALNLMDKHWAGYANAKAIVREAALKGSDSTGLEMHRAQPKYKRVDLNEYISLRPCSEGDEAINGTIREIKAKYGDLYEEVK